MWSVPWVMYSTSRGCAATSTSFVSSTTRMWAYVKIAIVGMLSPLTAAACSLLTPLPTTAVRNGKRKSAPSAQSDTISTLIRSALR